MTDDSDKREGQAGGPANKGSRQDRLKLALRENLKRRKSQARGRSDIPYAFFVALPGLAPRPIPAF